MKTAGVISYPRSGFSLLISVINQVQGFSRYNSAEPFDIRGLRIICNILGRSVERSINKFLLQHVNPADVIYNENFRQLIGGPKWLKADSPNTACFRKYIGIRGLGDFTLITTHPSAVLRCDSVIHSHVSPAVWLGLPDYKDRQFFSSIRHPVGTVTSACFSLNALASEYIQRHIEKENDNDLIRQKIALNKLSNLKFFRALITPFKKYLSEFAQVKDNYSLMKWEDLIEHPVTTIKDIGARLDVHLSDAEAKSIWGKLEHRNLTGAHKHNFRQGHGIVGGWKNWITNYHIDLLEDEGLFEYFHEFGYDLSERLDESHYTEFQRKLKSLIDRQEVYMDYGDEDLYGFAFNKTNIDITQFDFKLYPWKTFTQIERSSCKNNFLVESVSEIAELACQDLNSVIDFWMDQGHQLIRSKNPNDFLTILQKFSCVHDDELVASCTAALLSLENSEAESTSAQNRARQQPVLVEEFNYYNIVYFRDLYIALPQSLGPTDLSSVDFKALPGCLFDADLPALKLRLKQELAISE